MSDPRDTRDFEADAHVDAAWRPASREEPPAHLDDAILAAAREAVLTVPRRRADRPRTLWWQGWQALAAAAGVAGLALVLAQRLPTEAPSQRAAPASMAESAYPESKTVVAPAEPASAPVPPPAAAKNATASRPALVQQTPAANESGQGLESARAPALADAPAPAPAAADPWAARILELHASGQLERAAEELRAFRSAHPDADSYLPPELRPWAATVDATAPE